MKLIKNAKDLQNAKSTNLDVLQVADGKYPPKYHDLDTKRKLQKFKKLSFLKTESCKIIQYLEESFSYVIF